MVAKIAQFCVDAIPGSPARRRQRRRQLSSARLVRQLGNLAGHPIAQSRKTRYIYDAAMNSQLNVIERMFCRLKDRWRIAAGLTEHSDPSWARLRRRPRSSCSYEALP